MDRTERISVAVAALILTHSAALYFRVGPIEHELVSQVSAKLANRGFPQIAVQASGRDITLSGVVADRRDAARAVAVATDTTGVRAVHQALQTVY